MEIIDVINEIYSFLVNKIEFFWPLISVILPVLLIFFEFKRSRKLEVFNMTYDSILKAIDKYNEVSFEMSRLIARVGHIVVKLADNIEGDNIVKLDYELEEIDAKLEFETIFLELKEKYNNIEKYINDIYYLRNYYETEGKSYNKILEVTEVLEEHLRDSYGQIYTELDYTNQTHEIERHRYYRYLKTNKIWSHNFDREDIFELINYFNKNHIK